MEEENVNARTPSIRIPSKIMTCFLKFIFRCRSILGKVSSFLKTLEYLLTHQYSWTYVTVQETQIPTIRSVRRSCSGSENIFPGFCMYRYIAHASKIINTG